MKIGIAGLPHLTQNYSAALQNSAPVETEVSLLPQKALSWDGLLLPGGGDIDPPLLPGNPPPDPHCHNIEPRLDRQQLALLELFVAHKKPVLGICKGMQLIHLYFGGGLLQHLPTAEIHRYLEYDQLHPTYAKAGSFLYRLYGERFIVNSAHHQGILLQKTLLSKEIAVIQYSDDGVIEGFCHNTLPIIGLQWHPERLCCAHRRPDAIDGKLIFDYFLRLCREHCFGNPNS